MLSELNEQWKDLCQQASTEQDPTRLLELVREVNRLLEEKQHRTTGNGTDRSTK
jgi:hypothetical protein